MKDPFRGAKLPRWSIDLTLALAFGLSHFLSVSQSPYTPPDLWEEPVPTDVEFIENRGQLFGSDGAGADQVDFYSAAHYPQLFFGDNRISYTYHYPGDPGQLLPALDFRIDMEFVCVEPEVECLSSPVGVGQNAHHYNYFNALVPSGETGVPSFQKVAYESVWNDIDVVYGSNLNGPKIYFVVHPGGNPENILLRFSGQDSIAWDSGSGVEVYLNSKSLRLEDAVAYEVDGNAETTQLNWSPQLIKQSSDEVAIVTGSYDATNKLVLLIGQQEPPGIDRNVLPVWATYHGGVGEFESGNSMVIDSEGNVFITGGTGSFDFPINVGTAQDVYTNAQEGFVTKFNDQNDRVWGTFIGGGEDDEGFGIDVNEDGQIFAVFQTQSDSIDTDCNAPGVYCQDYADPPNSAGSELYIVELNPDGSRNWGTYFGGVGEDLVHGPDALDVDENGILRVVGTTESATSFPIVQNSNIDAYTQGILLGARDGFIAQFSPSNNTPVQTGVVDWVTYLGSNADDGIEGIESNSQNDFYIHGTTGSNVIGSIPCQADGLSAGFPLCDPAGSTDYYQTVSGGGFISRFNSSGEMTWSTFFGGKNLHNVGGLTIDGQDNLVVTGGTRASGSSANCAPPTASGEFPMCDPGGSVFFEDANQGELDGYISKFNSDNEIVWSTLYGGEEFDPIQAVTTDPDQTIYVVGQTNSLQFPTKYKWGIYFQSAHSDSTVLRNDAFIAAFDSNHDIRWGTFYGGKFTPNSASANVRLTESANDVASAPDRSLYMTGLTNSMGFPTSCVSGGPGISEYCRKAFDFATLEDDLDDAFVVRFDAQDVVGLTESQNAPPFEVFPNPSSGEITLKFSELADFTQLQVVDLTGRVIHSSQILPSDQVTFRRINLTETANGIYLIQAVTAESINTIQLIITK